jgi:hypothetical protein
MMIIKVVMMFPQSIAMRETNLLPSFVGVCKVSTAAIP